MVMKLDIVNRYFKFGILGSGAAMVMLYFVGGGMSGEWPKIWSYLATIGLAVLPEILRIIKIKPSQQLIFFYYLFLVPAMVFGINLDWYKTVPFYDKLIHGASGVLTVAVAKEILGDKLKNNYLLKVLFMIGFSALVAVLWECYEFGYDQIFDGRMQQLISVGVADTMWDLIMALVGGTIASLILSRFSE